MQLLEHPYRHVDVTGLFGTGTYGIFAASRGDALRVLAESDVIVPIEVVTDRLHPQPINNKFPEYRDELWQWTNQNRSLLYATAKSNASRVFVRLHARTGAATPRAGSNSMAGCCG